MPRFRVNGVELAYEVQGRGFPLVFSHSLLLDRRNFSHQMAELAKQYQTIGIDTHGHGESTSPATDLTLDAITDDFLKLLDQFRYARFVFVGLSMGGMIGLRLALKAPRYLKGLILIDTSGDAENSGRKYQYEALIQAAQEVGITPELADMVMPFMFSERFLREQQKLAREYKERLTKLQLAGVLKVAQAVIDRPSILDQLSQISVPTLILVGAQDNTQPTDESEKIRSRISQSKLVQVPDAGHISSVEQPEFVTKQISQFMQELGIN
ncbi:alpha/beta fold hydrolase [Candidatus Acetothermia bacterium]|nr:alpha/beta fold hydrolase [Candidatus Acetothermia bacterium]